jgi:type I restriction enzyme S subunit
MKTPRRNAAEMQSAELDGALLRPGDFALNDSAPPAAMRGRKTLVQGTTLGSVPNEESGSEMAEEIVLPEGWQWVALSKVVIKAKQTNPRAEPEREFTYVDVSSISRDALSIKETDRVLGRDAPSRARKLIRAGDVIFATVRPSLRRVALVPPDLDGQVCSTAFCVIRANPETADPGFLFFATAFEDFVKRVSEHQRGCSYPAVTDGQVLAERIPLPPVPEQRAIAGVLRTVQRGKEACERVLAATHQLKQSLHHHLLTYGSVPFHRAAHVSLREMETGVFPSAWAAKRFDEFATLQRGQDLARWEFRSGTVPVIGATTIIGYHDTANVKGPGVTVVRSGSSAGKPLFIGRDFWAHNVVLYVKDFHGNDPKFVFYMLLALGLTKFRSGVAVPTLNRNTFSGIQIAVPSLPEQREIARQLVAVDAKLAAEESRRAALAALFQSLLHHLMTGKVRLPGFAKGQQ